ncbi:D-alanyl-D-alanine carboxypeptidase/D-alanyl-D-alanine-endopeptidase [Luteolibacter ambystomatis]|uniref:D-alanyl-D-alanine carboxypeptidase/D-alanyl-D-alanine-endopeptidase n=1 Tax=Luteolibacter ambystomatis TaxID=2824561 RepID=A0A975IZ73_9BACT|nr:D-alanyl-D-alanine carboxypeptidase/D-alanyl-D-alanine-endopeptidase [Luteolibacter ambystomatis]QUE49395.1 D-alanyl-D-alanine carboxypeptidase/D-alanyl-D-alanine-endopeptidase [Luteolibacter ambystomatis]
MSNARRSKTTLVILLAAGWAAAGTFAIFWWRDSGVVWKQQAEPAVKKVRVEKRIETAPKATPEPRLEPSKVEEPPREGGLSKAFREWSARTELKGALVALCVLDEEGRTLFASPLAETALCPASSMKTLTTGAAFGLLGPDHRFETTLTANAKIDAAGVLDGDLELTGSGDPTLAREDLEAMADAVVAKGLKKISGGIVVNTKVFAAEPVSEHWNWGDIGNAYGAGTYGVNVDHNRMTLTFDPADKEGGPAKLAGSDPVLPGIKWDCVVATGAAGSGDQVTVFSEPYGKEISIRGSVPLGERGFTVNAAIPDPPAYAADVLRARLVKAGVKIAGGASRRTDTRVALAGHRSEALPEIIDHLHRVSDNLESQALYLTMGNLKHDDPAKVVWKFWEDAGVSFEGLRMIDGNGLARATMIRPLDLARVNLAASRAATGERYVRSLSGSGPMRSKRGAMSGVRTEVGFIQTPDGHRRVFALMGNGLDTNLDFWTLRTPLLEAVRTAAD